MGIFKIHFSKERVYGLDILRALAIFMVVFGHGKYIFSDQITRKFLSIPIFDGVSIFFVLSGFLIGGILIKTIETETLNKHSLIVFWKRRWFRTLPNYFLILSITYLALGYGEVRDIYKYFLFVQNLNSPHPKFFPEAWSLAVEEWFYLLIPIGLLLIIKLGIKPKQSILILIILIIVVSIFIRYYKFSTIEIETIRDWDVNFRKQVITRLDSIMFGVLGAFLNQYYYKKWVIYKTQLLILGMILLLLHKFTFVSRDFFNVDLNVYYCVYSFSLVSIATLLLLPFLSNYKHGNGMLYRVVTIFSLTSYSMYLINLSLVQDVILPIFIDVIPVPLYGVSLEIYTYLAYWFITVFGSILLYKYFEVPSIKLRELSIFSRKHINDKEVKSELS